MPGAFGAHLRARRRSAGLTQEQLAEKAHLSRGTVANLETGAAQSPGAETVEALALALGVSLAELWGESSAVMMAQGEKPSAESQPPMTVEHFIRQHGDDLTGREQVALTDLARTRPGAFATWAEDDWLALVRTLRKRFGKDL